MAAKKVSDKPSEAELERRDVRVHALLRICGQLTQTSIVCASVVLCVYFGIYLPVKEAHGEVTNLTPEGHDTRRGER
jgi:hypothetical protein